MGTYRRAPLVRYRSGDVRPASHSRGIRGGRATTLEQSMTNLILADALNALSRANSVFARLVEKSTYDVSLYKPSGSDPQTPHKRDELYVIASGTGDFVCE